MRPEPDTTAAAESESPAAPTGRGAVLREAWDMAHEEGSRLEEVAGIEAARGARCVAHRLRRMAAASQPTPLRWGLNDVMHGDDDTVTVLLSGPAGEPYWLELDPGRAAVLRQDLAGPGGGAADADDSVAEEQPSGLAALRQRLVAALDAAHRTHPCPATGSPGWSGCVHYDGRGRVAGVGACHSERRADAVLAVLPEAVRGMGTDPGTQFAADALERMTACPACHAGIDHEEHCPYPESHNWGCGCPSDVVAEHGPYARPRCPDCGMPHDLAPGSMGARVCASSRRKIAEADDRHAGGDHSLCCRAACEAVGAGPDSDGGVAEDPADLLRRAAEAAVADDGYPVFDAVVRDRRFVTTLRGLLEQAADALEGRGVPDGEPAVRLARALLAGEVAR